MLTPVGMILNFEKKPTGLCNVIDFTDQPKVWLSSSQPSGRPGSVKLVCQLDDQVHPPTSSICCFTLPGSTEGNRDLTIQMQDLPAVPTIEVTLPSNYPAQVKCNLKDHTLSVCIAD